MFFGVLVSFLCAVCSCSLFLHAAQRKETNTPKKHTLDPQHMCTTKPWHGNLKNNLKTFYKHFRLLVKCKYNSVTTEQQFLSTDDGHLGRNM
jgi:hypothetical protein